MVALKMFRASLLAVMVVVSFTVFSQSIQNTGKLNFPRSRHQSQLLPDGKVLAFGGWDNIFKSPTTYASAEVYDPALQTWTMAAPMSQARVFFTSVVLPNGNVMALGGDNGDGHDIALASCEIYDIQSKTWTPAASMNQARRNFRAIKLRNGQVLVVGGTEDNTCELYNPATNTWSYTGGLNVYRGVDGLISLVMLANGNIFATGGSKYLTWYAAETYNPQTGLWTSADNIIYPRADHNSVLLNNGKVLLVGSGVTASDGARYSEVYDASSRTPESTSRLGATVAFNNPLVLLDNGSVFSYTQGEYSPTNTQAFQIYTPSTNRWTAMTATNFFGNLAYTIHKLHDGSILIIGGYTSIDLGAVKDCLLVREPGVDVCTSTNLGLELSDNTFCYGTDGKVVVSGSEARSVYQAFIGDVAIGAAVNGGGDINLNIPASYIVPGVNRVRVKVTKSGCVSKFLSDVAILDAFQENIAKPVVTNAKPLAFCPGNNTVLQAPAGFSKYLWSNGETTQDITIATQSGAYSVRVFNSMGCASPNSDPANVNVYPSTVSAGSDEVVCISQPAFVLSGMSSVGGIWSGVGVTVDGKFDPAMAGPGTHQLVYTLCSRSSTKTVKVINPVLQDFVFQSDPQTICAYQSYQLSIASAQDGVYYQLRVGTKNIGKALAGSPGKPLLFPFNTIDTTTTFTVVATLTPDCGPPLIREKSTTVKILPLPQPYVSALVRDSVCIGESTAIRIKKSQPGITYSILQPPYSSALGNGEDLLLSTVPIAENRYFEVNAKNALGCIKELLHYHYVYVKPITVDFEPGLPGDFVGDTIRFINKSNALTYQWKFITPASVATGSGKDPGVITYSSEGKKEIQLIGTSSIGCVDSVTKVMDIAGTIDAGHYAACFQENIASGGGIVLDYHVDKNGNSYLTGHRDRRMFCMKVDSTGKTVWMRDMVYYGTILTGFGTGITSDTEGNTYVVGHATGRRFEFGKFAFNLEPDLHGTSPYTFIMKLNKRGEEQWIISATATATDSDLDEHWIMGSDITADQDNRIYVTGHRYLASAQIKFADGTIKLLEGTRNNGSPKNCFLLEIDRAGTMKDYQEFGGGSRSHLRLNFGATIRGWMNSSANSYELYYGFIAVNPKIKIDYDGDVLIGGVFEAASVADPFTFGNRNLYTVQGEGTYYESYMGSTFVAEYNKAQGWKSATRAVSLGVDYLQEFAKDRDGNIYTTGPLYYGTIINGDTISLQKRDLLPWETPDRYSYLAKTNALGQIEWHTINKSAYIHDLALSDHNTIFATGQFNRFGALDDARHQSFGMVSHGKSDAFMSEYTGEGDLLWAQPQGASKVDHPFFIESDACNTIYACTANDLDYSNWPRADVNGSMTLSRLSPFGDCSNTACAPKKLTLVNFDPGEGSHDDQVNISGTNFTYVNAVTFNGVNAAFTVISDEHLVATVPVNATTGKIALRTYNESVTSNNNFVIDKLRFIDFTPKYGAAGTVVTIYAEHIGKVQAVKFNTTEAAFIMVNDSTLQAAVPQGAVTGPISLAASGETVASNDAFTIDLIEVPTGMEEDLSAKCVVYPNPTAGAITLECLAIPASFNVEIVNVLGITVAQQRLAGASRSTVNLDRLPPGVYQVIVFNDRKRAAYRVVKQ